MSTVAGLQVFNENGVVTYDSATVTTKQIGSGTTGTEDGSLTDENINGRNVWILIREYVVDSYVILPSFSYDGNVISWTFKSMYSGHPVSCDFIYGVY